MTSIPAHQTDAEDGAAAAAIHEDSRERKTTDRRTDGVSQARRHNTREPINVMLEAYAGAGSLLVFIDNDSVAAAAAAAAAADVTSASWTEHASVVISTTTTMSDRLLLPQPRS